MAKLTLNFAPLSLEGATTVLIGSHAYDAERLADLRSSFRTTHVFRRDGDTVLDIPIAVGAKPLGNVTQQVDLAKERKLWAGLMQATLLRVFAGQRDIYSDYPVTVIGSVSKGLIHHRSLPAWMQRRTSLQFETRTIFSGRDSATAGLIVETRTRNFSNSRIGSRQRYVGITTVFSSDASYLLSDRTSAVPYDEYPQALFETVKRSIAKVRTDDNWRSTDKVRLVFHVFKPLKDAEAEAIKRAVEDQGLSEVTFAFVHIAQDQPLSCVRQHAGRHRLRQREEGHSWSIARKLGDFESLIVFSGASELKQASDGTPRPCLLKLHRLSTFSDMTYLARQAYEFAGNSWRMLAPEPFPITIRYSDLIAERLAGLSAVSGWDPDTIQFGQIGRTLWFL